MNGWIKIHRDIMNHWIWQDEKYFRWWMTILLTVNHEAKKFPVNSELYVCNPGESFRSIEEWRQLFKCSKPTVQKFFKLLENDKMIIAKTVGKGNRRKHLLTVLNWKKYQQQETENFTENKPETLPKINPKLYRKCTSNKNDKNEKNEKREKESTPTSGKNEDIDFSKLINIFNETCKNLPQIVKITESRKKAIRARVREYGKEDVVKVIKKTAQSKFLNGENDRGWKADFDWIFKPNNFLKIFEGGYSENTKNIGRSWIKNEIT